MPFTLALTVLDGRVRAAPAGDADTTLAETPLDGLPALAELRSDPLEAGRALYDALGGDALRARLDANDDALLLLRCDEAAAAIAWEYAATPDGLLCCEYGLLRAEERAPRPAAPGQPRLLVLCADPLDRPGPGGLDFKRELKALREALSSGTRQLLAERIPPTAKALFEALANGSALLHLSCHGASAGEPGDKGLPVPAEALLLEDEYGRAEPLPGRTLSQRGRGRLRLVLLSACRTAGIARALCRDGVPLALGMQHDFPDEQSAALAATLFRWLAAGQPLPEALRQARCEIADGDPGAAGLLAAYTCDGAWRQFALPEGQPDVSLDPPGAIQLPDNVAPPALGLIGRDAELVALAQALDEAPVVTVAGAGGMGKTALAGAYLRRFGWRYPRVLGVSFAAAQVDLARVCRELLERMGQAQAAAAAQDEAEQRHAELARITRARLRVLEQQRATFGDAAVPANILLQIEQAERELAALNANDLRAETAAKLQERLLAAVRPGDLLVFDNYESVLAPAEADRAQAASIQRLLPLLLEREARLLLTSRERPAGLPGEALFPPQSALDGLAEDDAVELFTRHSARAKSKTAPEQHQRVAREVARATAGYPLAVALLAGAYDAQDASAENFLANWPAMLARARREGLAPHHVTFAAAFERSFDTLTEQQQARLLALRPFGFPFFAEAAALLWGLPAGDDNKPTDEALGEARRDLALFARRNLVEVDARFKGTDDPATWRVQPVLRQELARRVGDDGRAQAGYAGYGEWLGWRAYGNMDSDYGLANLVRQSFDVFDMATSTLEGEQQLWHIRNVAWLRWQYGEYTLAREMLEAALATEGDPSNVRDHLLFNLAILYRTQGDLERAMQIHEDRLTFVAQSGDANGRSSTLREIGKIYRAQGNLEHAMNLYQDSLTIDEQFGNLKGKGVALHEMAIVYTAQGDLDQALRLYQESLAIKEQTNDLRGKAATLSQLSNIHAAREHWDIAQTLVEESLSLAKKLGDLYWISLNIVKLGQIAQARGDLPTALSHYRNSLAMYERMGMRREIQQIREHIARAEEQQRRAAMTHEERVAEITARVEADVVRALQSEDVEERQRVLAKLDKTIASYTERETLAPPYAELAAFMRAVAALLRGEPPAEVPAAYAERLAALREVGEK